ncbi:LolA family protein [Luteibaculum oceani]|uniref:Outer membrane lipoprotein carrier protein LolA n=1 Tax=Luteibaculum oceani TaxID=1294296 RepID=A0A5C6VFD0_9FLAO|nr:outer membrane lipoprotein carrier protein LolA [Luteibaculum oceani]TXC81988.1 outer membrane lipoprotein carrier protein LolA [Luteibaculum oceani]
MKYAVKTLLLLVSCISFITSTLAQESSDPKAKKILDELSGKTKGYATITASFNSTLENKQANMKVDQEGVIKLKGTKFNLVLDDYIILSDGESTWTVVESDNEVYIDDLSALTGGDINPSEIFTLWEKGFKYNYKGEETVNGKACHHINLYPKNPSEKNYHTIKLYVDKAAMEISKVVVMGKGGDIYTYQIKSFKPNEGLSDALFVFDKKKYPGISVVDNRF